MKAGDGAREVKGQGHEKGKGVKELLWKQYEVSFERCR